MVAMHFKPWGNFLTRHDKRCGVVTGPLLLAQIKGQILARHHLSNCGLKERQFARTGLV